MIVYPAVAILETWQAVVLILLCFGSLIIALYCLFFMVPLKSFVRRINSLGGGVRGIRAHVNGVRSETEKRISVMEEVLRNELGKLRADLQGALDAAADSASRAHSGLQGLERTVQHFQAQLREHSSDGRKLSEGLAHMRKELSDLRNDLDVVEVELRGSVSQLASDSYKQLEATVLGALEVLQDEMLRAADKLRGSGERPASWKPSPSARIGTTSGKDSRRRASGKIIPAEPLFAELDKGSKGEASKGGPDQDESRRTQQETAPAK